MAAMYGVLTVPGAIDSGPIISLGRLGGGGGGGGGRVPGLIVIEIRSSELSALLQPSWSGSFSSNQNENDPAWIGVPESVPFVASERPGGTVPLFAYHMSSPGRQMGSSSP